MKIGDEFSFTIDIEIPNEESSKTSYLDSSDSIQFSDSELSNSGSWYRNDLPVSQHSDERGTVQRAVYFQGVHSLASLPATC